MIFLAVPMSAEPQSEELLDWEWIYEEATAADDGASTSRKRKASEAFAQLDSRRIVGAKKGDEEYRIGDAVILKAPRNETWVAMLYEFLEDESEDGKEAKLMWFTSPKDIRNKIKRRTDAMSVRCLLGLLGFV